MDIDQIAPELRPAFRKFPKLPLDKRYLLPVINFLLRFIVPSKMSAGVSLSQRTNKDLRLRIYTPAQKKSDGCLLWIHGGGLIIGSPKLQDTSGSELAAKLGIVVVAPQYRLAPKHAAPAAIDDCFDQWQWLLDNAARLGVDPDKIAIGGQSAGGGLAACLAQKIADGTGPKPIAQILVYPMLDDRTAADRSLDNIDHAGWNNKFNLFGWSSYLAPNKPGAQNLPSYTSASRREDLTDLPQAWIGVGDIDLFCSEDKTYAARLNAQGVKTELRVVKGAFHGFDGHSPEVKVTIDFKASMVKFIDDRL